MKNYWLTKNTEGEIKDVDFNKRTVSGYFARFNNIDSDGDMIKSGAFLKSIHENGHRIKHLKNHNPDKMIGRITDIHEDGTGLHFTSVLSKNSHGTDALIEYQEGLITEHSIGYNIIKAANDNDQYQLLEELRLFEGSAVTWGANEETPVTGIKGISDVKDLKDELDSLLKYCHIAGFSDELYSSTEIKIKQIQQAITNLEKDSQKPEVKEDSTTAEADEMKAKVLAELGNIFK